MKPNLERKRTALAAEVDEHFPFTRTERLLREWAQSPKPRIPTLRLLQEIGTHTHAIAKVAK